MQVDHIIHAKWIIACETTNTVLDNHALVIEKNLIKDILPSKAAEQKYTAQSMQHYNHHAITPGFINAHTHLAMNYFRGLADDLALMDWLKNHIWPTEKKWASHEFVRDASLFAMAEMIRGGTTCFNDMYFFLQATAEAAEIAGLRAHIGITLLEQPTTWAQTAEEYLAKGLEFYEIYKNYPLIKTTLAPHAPYTVSDENLLRVKEIAEKYNLKINIHLHESTDEINQSLQENGKRPIQRLHDIGFLDPRVIAIHMANINDDDLKILAKTKPAIVHCPESNMKLASGAAPIVEFHKAKFTVALGTDGAASNNDLDMFGEMRSASLLAKLTTHDSKNLSAAETLHMATLQGAKALGIDNVTGSLKPGKSADFIAIDLEQIETQPLYHPISQIVYAASRQQVTDTWVAGKQLMKNRALLTLDEKELLRKAKHWHEKIANH
jgi:5-methylthioadenosine/S-adenosylhomocysteine deaminase